MTSRAITGRAPTLEPTTRHFAAEVIDGVPRLLERSYRLRYEVYCRERNFLNAVDYPTGLEIDDFDRYSLHVGAVDAAGELAGTARLIPPSPIGFPLHRHCTLYPDDWQSLPQQTTVEFSRLSVSRHYRRGRTDDDYGFGVSNAPNEDHSRERRRVEGEVFLTVVKALYQASKRAGFTHWLVATEKSLQRILARSGFSFRQVGPETDYFGKVAPYALELRELDRTIASGANPVLLEFVVGLAPELSSVMTDVERRLVRLFRHAAEAVPAYATLIGEQKVAVDQVVDVVSFSRVAPTLSKANTFDRFTLDDLSVGGMLPNLADVLTSSGHGGRFSFGVSTRAQAGERPHARPGV